MVASFGNRMRALWLACLLAFAPGGPVGLLLTGHAAGEIAHATATPIHDASDHGISAGALADTAARPTPQPDAKFARARDLAAGRHEVDDLGGDGGREPQRDLLQREREERDRPRRRVRPWPISPGRPPPSIRGR